MRKVSRIFIALILAVFHVSIVSLLFFYGTVIEPQLSHQIMTAIAFFMSLPIGLMIFLPQSQLVNIAMHILIFGFWSFVYFRLLKKVNWPRK